jgi:hypothetical protein
VLALILFNQSFNGVFTMNAITTFNADAEVFAVTRTSKKGVEKTYNETDVILMGKPEERMQLVMHRFLTLWKNADFFAFSNEAVPSLLRDFPSLRKTVEARNEQVEALLKEDANLKMRKIDLDNPLGRLELIALVNIASKAGGADKGIKSKWMTVFKAVIEAGIKAEEKAAKKLEGEKQ